MKRNRIGVIVFALLGMAIVFAVSFMVLQRQAPEGVRVLVAAQDIAVGSTLTADMLRYDVVNASPQTLAALLPQTDEAQVLGKVLIRDVSVGQPLTWTLFGDAANPDAASRVALTYGPDFVAMVVPFSALFVPDRILPGDRVDLLMSVPANLGYGRPLDPALADTGVAAGGLYTSSVLTPTVSTPTPTSVAPLMNPSAKRIIANAEVLEVVRETRTQQFTTTDGKTAVREVPGAIQGLVLLIPRQAAEMVQFGIDNGVLRAAVISAQAVTHVSGAPEPSLGVMWNDYVAFVETQRLQALGDSNLPPLYGPGAADLILAAGPTPPSGSGPSSSVAAEPTAPP